MESRRGHCERCSCDQQARVGPGGRGGGHGGEAEAASRSGRASGSHAAAGEALGGALLPGSVTHSPSGGEKDRLETIADAHFERFGGRRIEVGNNVRVTSSQDNTWSKVQQDSGFKNQGHHRYRISGIHKFFLANKGGASIRVLLWESLLIPDMLTLMLQPETTAGIDRESIPSPQPDEGRQNGNQSLRCNIIVLNTRIQSVELCKGMVSTWAMRPLIDLQTACDSIDHQRPLRSHRKQSAHAKMWFPFPVLQHVLAVPKIVRPGQSIDLYRRITLLRAKRLPTA